jgi:hypothetical protein
MSGSWRLCTLSVIFIGVDHEAPWSVEREK